MLDSPLVTKIIKLAIAEDYSDGDITSELAVDRNAKCSAILLARENLVICGLELVEKIFSGFGWKANIKLLAEDGHKCKANDVLAKIEGNARQVLAAERTILNFLQHLSGVATLTKRIVDKNKGLTILDTRKTTPGLRLLEKYAVSIGGAKNHRMGLGDMILLKNNHVDINLRSKPKRGLADVLKHINRKKPPYMPLEVEVRTLDELREALKAFPEIVMLDNMNDATMKRAVKLSRELSPNTFIEASGGMTEARLKRMKSIGIDGVSMGMLTRMATKVDISLRIK